MHYFTSDWHIGHEKEFLYKPRGFNSIEEHDTALLLKCNQIVEPEDHLWILGDLCMGRNEKEWDRIYKALFCKNIHFIIGNHDTNNKCERYEKKYGFINEGLAAVIKVSKRRSIFLSHYPTIVGNYENGGPSMWNLSGHTHMKNKFYDN